MAPKFRVWSEYLNIMGVVESLGFDMWGVEVCFTTPNGYYEEDYGNVILMQSTGLFDKNGVEIFEGDIVKGGSITYKVHHGIHSFNEFSGVGFYLIWESDGIYIVEKLSPDVSYEVVGNVYEHPHLMEEID